MENNLNYMSESKSLYRTIIHFVRHGESTLNVEKKFGGSGSDVELTIKGIEQSFYAGKKLAENFPNINYIFRSNMTRTEQTANEINKSLKLNISVDPELRERYYGDLECADSDFVMGLYEKHSDGYDFMVDFGGESNIGASARIKNSICKYFTSGLNEILLVSHGHFAYDMYKIFLGKTYFLQNAEHVILDPANIGNLGEICGETEVFLS